MGSDPDPVLEGREWEYASPRRAVTSIHLPQDDPEEQSPAFICPQDDPEEQCVRKKISVNIK